MSKGNPNYHRQNFNNDQLNSLQSRPVGDSLPVELRVETQRKTTTHGKGQWNNNLRKPYIVRRQVTKRINQRIAGTSTQDMEIDTDILETNWSI